MKQLMVTDSLTRSNSPTVIISVSKSFELFVTVLGFEKLHPEFLMSFHGLLEKFILNSCIGDIYK